MNVPTAARAARASKTFDISDTSKGKHRPRAGIRRCDSTARATAGDVRRGRIESYCTRADGSAAITMEYLGVSPDGLKVELWSALEDDPGDALDSRAAACGDERGYAAASEAAARTTSDSRQFVRALAAMPEELAAQGYRAADPFDFFNIAASTLGIYRVDVDGEVYWPAGEE